MSRETGAKRRLTLNSDSDSDESPSEAAQQGKTFPTPTGNSSKRTQDSVANSSDNGGPTSSSLFTPASSTSPDPKRPKRVSKTPVRSYADEDDSEEEDDAQDSPYEDEEEKKQKLKQKKEKDALKKKQLNNERKLEKYQDKIEKKQRKSEAEKEKAALKEHKETMKEIKADRRQIALAEKQKRKKQQKQEEFDAGQEKLAEEYRTAATNIWRKATDSNVTKRRSSSAPIPFSRISCLVEKTPVLSTIPLSAYEKELNKARGQAKDKIVAVTNYLRACCCFDDDEYFITIQDPFWKIAIDCGDTFLSCPLSEEDTLEVVGSVWTAEHQKMLPEKFEHRAFEFSLVDFCKVINIQPMSSLSLNGKAQLDQPNRRFRELEFFAKKFCATFRIWKTKTKEYPRVVQLFFGAVQKIFNIEFKEAPNMPIPPLCKSLAEELQLVRDLLFWLPVHLSDVRSAKHFPRTSLLDLARQLFGSLLDEFPIYCSEILEEEIDLLKRLQISSLRMEFSAPNIGPYKSLCPYRGKSFGLFEIGKKEKYEKKIAQLKVIHRPPVLPSRPVRRRNNSFSEYTVTNSACLEQEEEEQDEEDVEEEEFEPLRDPYTGEILY